MSAIKSHFRRLSQSWKQRQRSPKPIACAKYAAASEGVLMFQLYAMVHCNHSIVQYVERLTEMFSLLDCNVDLQYNKTRLYKTHHPHLSNVRLELDTEKERCVNVYSTRAIESGECLCIYQEAKEIKCRL